MNRRQFLYATGMAAGGADCGCYRSRPRTLDPLSGNSCDLAPVLVSPEREIRTVVGLRPFRPSGFVVKAEKVGGKLVIHNYRHGGAGITLSWGTLQLATALLPGEPVSSVAVLGCGAVGLATARMLQDRGVNSLTRSDDQSAGVAGKHLATTRYLSALGTAVEAHLGTIVPGPRDAGSLPDGRLIGREPSLDDAPLGRTNPR